MKDLLSDDARSTLEAVARDRLLLAFDFDGALAPLGDDTTDEDAFRSLAVRVSIRVGRKAGSAASHFVESQGHMDALLRALASARRRVDGLEDRTERLERFL